MAELGVIGDDESRGHSAAKAQPLSSLCSEQEHNNPWFWEQTAAVCTGPSAVAVLGFPGPASLQGGQDEPIRQQLDFLW